VSAPQLGKGDWAHHGHGRRSVPGKGRPLGRSTEARSQLGSSASLENLSRALMGNPGSMQGVVPTHSRQRSSPDTLLYTMEPIDYPAEEEPPLTPCQDVGMGLFVTHSSSPEFVPPKEGLFGQEDGTEGTPMLAALGWNIEDPAEDTEDANTSEEAPPELAEPLQEACLEAGSPMEGRPLPPIPADAPLGTLTGSSQQVTNTHSSGRRGLEISASGSRGLSQVAPSPKALVRSYPHATFSSVLKTKGHLASILTFLKLVFCSQPALNCIFFCSQDCSKAALPTLKKSCVHSAGKSFDAQVQRLKASGYPSSIIYDVAESLITSNKKHDTEKHKKHRPTVLPYIHRLSHNLKRTAAKFQVQVVLSAPDKLKRLRPKITASTGRVQCKTLTQVCRMSKWSGNSNTIYLWQSICRSHADLLTIVTQSTLESQPKHPVCAASREELLGGRNPAQSLILFTSKAPRFKLKHRCKMHLPHSQKSVTARSQKENHVNHADETSRVIVVVLLEPQAANSDSERNGTEKYLAQGHSRSHQKHMRGGGKKKGRTKQKGGSHDQVAHLSRRLHQMAVINAELALRIFAEKYLARVERDHGDDFDHQSAMHHLNHDAAERGLQPTTIARFSRTWPSRKRFQNEVEKAAVFIPSGSAFSVYK
ncbi:unnamed protein product, partial [Ixodes pacificus]